MMTKRATKSGKFLWQGFVRCSVAGERGYPSGFGPAQWRRYVPVNRLLNEEGSTV